VLKKNRMDGLLETNLMVWFPRELFMALLERVADSPVQLLSDRVAEAPGALALLSPDGECTRAQLWEDAGRIAAALVRSGVASGEPVALLLDPGGDLVRSVWGVLRTRSPYLPLAPEYPQERLRFMVKDSGAGVIITQEHLRQQALAVAAGVPVMTVEEMLTASPDSGDDGLGGVSAATAADVAYVIYTSGSTGRPKGVMVQHRALAHQMRWIGAQGVLPADARILQKTPFSFDAAQWEIVATAVGAVVVTGQPGLHRDPDALARAVQQHAVTALQCVPTLWRALAESGQLGSCDTLTHLYSGGELLTVALARRLRQAVPGCELVNLYGPTETTINTTAFRVTDRWLSQHASGGVPLGDPVTDMRLLVLDEALTEVADGETGELFITGPQLALGYLDNPDLTREQFLTRETLAGATQRMYRTGDRVTRQGDQLLFGGRVDHQVKVNGHRIETDEVRLAVTEHQWVREACVVPWTSSRTGVQQLAAFVELEPDEAALMDEGQAGHHHQSKSSRVQVRAQLAGHGLLAAEIICGLPITKLPAAAATAEQQEYAFRRKTYRFFRGQPVNVDDLTCLARLATERSLPDDEIWQDTELVPARLDLETLGSLLRWFGPFSSRDRLLPKYAYASPGALAATQVHLEVRDVPGLLDGWYWFHSVDHALIRLSPEISRPSLSPVGATAASTSPDRSRSRAPRPSVPTSGRTAETKDTPDVRLHFLGKRSAITTVYSTNVDEVLHIESGHMLGLLEDVSARMGLQVAKSQAIDRPVSGGMSDDVVPLLSVRIEPVTTNGFSSSAEVRAASFATHVASGAPSIVRAKDAQGVEDLPEVTVLVQEHRGAVRGLGPGLHRLEGHELRPVGKEVVRRRDVIAINQAVFDRASFGISLLAPRSADWRAFVAVGRALHRMQVNDSGLGLMSSGYSSASGRDLPSARRLDLLRGQRDQVSYFAVGGPLSPGQQVSRGMDEDIVHMKGPAEILKDELKRTLPPYMLPARLEVVESLPKTPNGKCDVSALRELAAARDDARAIVPPATATEDVVVQIWQDLLGLDEISTDDDFFAVGGNSLVGVAMINRLNTRLGTELPLQSIFESPTPAQLARTLHRPEAAFATATASRFVDLVAGHFHDDRPPESAVYEGTDAAAGSSGAVPVTTEALAGERSAPIYCWPGLGGFPMNLRELAAGVANGRRVLGVQAVGINPGEQPHATIRDMAAADVAQIITRQPEGRLTLVGYSFGARVAFETAAQLEAAGRTVSSLVLIAPGSPRTRHTPRTGDHRQGFDSPYFVEILLSVFTGSLPSEDVLADCMATVSNATSFCDYVSSRNPDLPAELVQRVTAVVQTTFEFNYTFRELEHRTVTAPITVIRAAGDDYSFLETHTGWSSADPHVVDLEQDHYSILHGTGLPSLIRAVAGAVTPPATNQDSTGKATPMPHLTIKHFPVDLTTDERTALSDELSKTIAKIFHCRPGVVSIALEEIQEHEWDPRVVQPEIVGRRELLCKEPDYVLALNR